MGEEHRDKGVDFGMGNLTKAYTQWCVLHTHSPHAKSGNATGLTNTEQVITIPLSPRVLMLPQHGTSDLPTSEVWQWARNTALLKRIPNGASCIHIPHMPSRGMPPVSPTHRSCIPAGVNVAAAWDKRLAYQRGVAMGEEHRDKGVDGKRNCNHLFEFH
jgi:hypothetical protein